MSIKNVKHLMTGPKGNSVFCFPETLNEHCGLEGKQNSLFPVGPVIKCFVIPPNSKIEQITYVSKELRSILFSASKLCCRVCSLQNSVKGLTAFCACRFVCGFGAFIPYQLFNFFFCSDLKAFLGRY